MRKPTELPVLLDERGVKRLLGRVPRELENVVMFDPKGRKLFRRSCVLSLVPQQVGARAEKFKAIEEALR